MEILNFSLEFLTFKAEGFIVLNLVALFPKYKVNLGLAVVNLAHYNIFI